MISDAPLPLTGKTVFDNEKEYIAAVSGIIERGKVRLDRTGVGTISQFVVTMRFDLAASFPLLTLRRLPFKTIVKELLWFIRGDTSSTRLEEDGVKIWKANASREFLDSRGLTDRKEGDLGPIYGFQWRYWGADYKSCDVRYKNQGIDQLQKVINQIKTEPTSRRIILSSWNVSDLDKMALPPCHLLCQFYVESGRLSCHLTQRSGDMGLGVPFNIASYSLLTMMIAHICGLGVGELVHTVGDAHIYSNHVEKLRMMLDRKIRVGPRVTFARKVSTIDEFVSSDFVLSEYNPYPAISLSMAV